MTTGLFRSPLHQQQHERNLLHTISGVLHSQSVRIAPSATAHQANNLAVAAARRSMLVAARPQQLVQLQQQATAFQGSQTLGRLGGQRLFREQQQQQVPLQVERLGLQQQQLAQEIPLQRLNTGAATLRRLPEGSILSRLAQEQQQADSTGDGGQFVRMNLQQQQQPQQLQQATYITGTCSDTYVPFLPASAAAPATFVTSRFPQAQQPVHSNQQQQ